MGLPLHSMQDNHPGELDLYCSGSCPIVLATANHYCGSQIESIRSLFDGKCNYVYLIYSQDIDFARSIKAWSLFWDVVCMIVLVSFGAVGVPHV